MLAFLRKKEFWLSLLMVMVLCIVMYFLFFNVFLSIYTGHGKSVEIPDVVRKPLSEAETIITEAGLRVEVTDSLYDPKLKPRSVIAMVPAAHERVKPGRPVFLTVNQVVPPTVTFPSDVIYTSVYQAKLRLESWKLQVGDIEAVYSDYKDLVLKVKYNGKVLKEGDKLPQGSTLVLVVGKGDSDDKVGVPCLEDKSYSEAISELHSTGLNFDLQFKPESKEEKGMVISQYPRCASDDSVSIGTQITLIIAGPEPEEAPEVMPDGDDGE